jgi:hypothetical protein
MLGILGLQKLIYFVNNRIWLHERRLGPPESFQAWYAMRRKTSVLEDVGSL